MPLFLKCWFYKQAPQKVLIELSPGVISSRIMVLFKLKNIRSVSLKIFEFWIKIKDSDKRGIKNKSTQDELKNSGAWGMEKSWEMKNLAGF